MEPLAVLVVMPVLIGAAAAFAFHDTTRASLAAGVLSSALIYACLSSLDPGGTWNGLATFLVSPLVIAFSLATVLTCVGFREGRRPHRRRHAT
jgi:CHASE2 domain-containing sensor protein